MTKNREWPYVQYMYSYPHKTAYRELDGIMLDRMWDELKGQKNSLYFHIPFCQYKCGYCNLFSVAGAPETDMERYVDAMERQAEQYAESMPKEVLFNDLTLGGGTPLYLPEKLLERVFKIAHSYFSFASEDKNIVVETSPNQTTDEKAAFLKEQKVTRVSLGIQSFQEEELKTLCRFHDISAAGRAVSILKKYDFESLNLDFIYGIPGQSEESLKDTLQKAVAYEPEELFVYPLYVKPGTILYNKGLKSSKDTYKLYVCARDFLWNSGYSYYSMRRFYKKSEGMEKRNILSCGFENTLSVGCGGRSYIGNLHFCTPYVIRPSYCRKTLNNYINQRDFMKINHGLILSEEEVKRRFVIKNILFDSGLSEDEYFALFGEDVKKAYPILAEWEKQEFASITCGRIKLTELGISYSDALGPLLISDDVAERMKLWKEPVL